MPLDSDILKNISDYAHEQISRRSNSAVYRRLIHLHEASSQVVAGINYKLVLDSGYTKCRRNGDATNEVISSCDLDKERVSHYVLKFICFVFLVCPSIQ